MIGDYSRNAQAEKWRENASGPAIFLKQHITGIRSTLPVEVVYVPVVYV
jgi:hypothetical protein